MYLGDGKLKILVLPDSFKESLDSINVAKAISRGLRKVNIAIEVESYPLSDGGEGFLDSVFQYMNLRKTNVKVTDLAWKRRKVAYGWCPDKRLAVIETARIVGLHLVPPQERKPEKFTSYGVGEAIMKAVKKGAKEIVIGLGGSGVNDGGAGIAQALGYKLLDDRGEEVGWGPLNLLRVKKIVPPPGKSLLQNVSILIASDVKNPYYGKSGATLVYGPQKGLAKELCPKVDRALRNFARVIKKDLGVDVQGQPGSGSAGGMGGALFAFAGGRFISGFEWIRKIANLDKRILNADLVITGEGQLDYQTSFGKLVSEVVRFASSYEKKIIVLVGRLGKGWEVISRSKNVVVFPVSAGEFSREELLKNCYSNLVRTAEQVGKFLMWQLF